jgi:membrane fusion protein, heavy metal efflux system
MNRMFWFKTTVLCEIAVGATLSFMLAGCGKSEATAKADSGDTAPPPAQVEPDMDVTNVKVDHPEQFPVVTAGSHAATTELNATANVYPDTAKQVPVISTATGKVIDIKARVGDEVQKGQLLFTVRSTDIAGAFSDYRHAVAAEKLSKLQLDRAKILLDDGAIPKSQLEIAQTAEDTALVDVDTTAKHLQVLGVADPNNPSDIISMVAPVSGVITDQQITNSAAVQAFAPSNPSPTNPYSTGYPFTISDMSDIWIICDVFENNLAQIHMDEYVDVRLNAYPNRVFKGRISNIGQILDPVLHTAKVRLEVPNTDRLMRIGMFASVTFHGDTVGNHALVPSSAILNLHDSNFVYVPGADNHFRRIEVVPGVMMPDKTQEVVSGIKPGDKVVSNALVLQSTVEQ